MLAYADGKKIEFMSSDEEVWADVDDPVFNWYGNISRYRVKYEPKYRPFEDADECWQEMQKHQPFGWLVHDGMNYKIHINFLCSTSLAFEGGTLKGFTTLLDEGYTFADGTPFGIMEESV